jgi:PAS domain-containing protein
MVASAPPQADGTGVPPFPDGALIEVMERIPEPALLYRPGGRIAAVNRAAVRLSGLEPVGRTIGDLIGHYRAQHADGSPLLPGDLPWARAIRGEVVDQGERVDMTLPNGSTYRALVTSTPVIVDGKVMGALSVWHDFDAYIRSLVLPSIPPSGPAERQ